MNLIQVIQISLSIIGFLISMFIACSMFYLLRLWFKCFINHCDVPLHDLIRSRLRGAPTKMLVDAVLMLHHQGREADFTQLEQCYLANPNRARNVESLVELLSENHQYND